MSDKTAVIYRVNEETRTRLRHPFGQLVLGSPERTMPILKEIIAKGKPRKVIAVGDVVASNMRRFGIATDLSVVDGKTMRGKTEETVCGPDSSIVRNLPGGISKEAFEGLKKALERGEPRVVCVEGEEDLLVLPVVVLAPPDSMVVYGQPFVGLVVVSVVPSARQEAQELLLKMRVRASRKG